MPPEMQDFLAGVTLLDLITWLTVLAGGFAAVKWVVPFARKVSHFIDDVAGEPARPGVPARPGLMERVTSIEATQVTHGKSIEVVRHELFPNSGKSMRDQTNRMEQKLDADNDRISELSDRLDEHITQSELIIKNLPKEKP
jgi:hypothetical protein